MSDPTPQRYTPTTTHSAWGSGHPRLLVSNDVDRWVHEIDVELTRIGSSTDLEIVLVEAAPLHATVTHAGEDEYVLTMHGPGSTNAWTHDVDGTERSEVLRTGAHFTAGPWRLVFVRDEYADHGRPYGGRQGGEFAHQKRQAPRPDYETARAALAEAVLTEASQDAAGGADLPFEVVDDTAGGVYAAVADGREVGGITYNLVGDERIVLLAVSVLPQYRRRGIATALVRSILDLARAQHRTVTNYCPVVRTFIRDNPEYADLIDPQHPGNAR